MKFILASARTFPPEKSEGWTINFYERESRYWVSAQAGHKDEQLFKQGTQETWQWVKGAKYIRWFTDGERRYGKELWKLASVYLSEREHPTDYPFRKVWREGLEVAMKIKGSQGRARVEWVKRVLDVQRLIYNWVRPHWSLGKLTPAMKMGLASRPVKLHEILNSRGLQSILL